MIQRLPFADWCARQQLDPWVEEMAQAGIESVPLPAMLNDGLPANLVFAGGAERQAWGEARAAQRILESAARSGHGWGMVTLIPPGSRPSGFRWTLFSGLPVTLVMLERNDDLRDDVMLQLLQMGRARRVFAVDGTVTPWRLTADGSARKAA